LCLQILVSFGLVLGLQSTRFPKNTGWKNSALLGHDFSLLPVEPTLAFLSVGSTGEWFCHLLGFLGFFCGCTGVSAFVSIGSTGVSCERDVLIV